MSETKRGKPKGAPVWVLILAIIVLIGWILARLPGRPQTGDDLLEQAGGMLMPILVIWAGMSFAFIGRWDLRRGLIQLAVLVIAMVATYVALGVLPLHPLAAG